mmetsp:Transcript_22305/g.44948  ORF Transcript_22305/g.44948 Transcript_22305/m.44948 type:complete len:99 (-) Transcript_22305:78-374(-)
MLRDLREHFDPDLVLCREVTLRSLAQRHHHQITRKAYEAIMPFIAISPTVPAPALVVVLSFACWERMVETQKKVATRVSPLKAMARISDSTAGGATGV